MTWWKWLGIATGITTLWAVFATRASAAPLAADTSGGTAPPWWTAADYRALAAMAARLGMNAADLGLIMASESGLNPHAAYPGNYAVGLNQITAVAAAPAGLTEAQRQDFPNWPVARQLPRIEQMFRFVNGDGAFKYPHAGAIYAVNAAPSIVRKKGTGYNVVLYERGVDGKRYDQNAGLDTNKDGKITVGDLDEHLRAVAQRAVYKGWLAALRAATNDPTISPRLPTS